jgi:hypothetical protein
MRMGIWKRIFGGDDKPARTPRAEEPLDAGALIEELKAEGPGAKAGDVTVKSSPRDVIRYTFVRLAAGTPAATLRADFIKRGFSGRVADAYITLVQSTLFPGR